jgi:hypothetical protein
MTKFHQGTYKPENPEKYMGNKPPYYRSSWELRCFKYFDNNKNIISWGSETVTIPYFSALDNKNHRYYPDIYAKVRTRDGKVKEYIIEIKPLDQSIKPKPPKNKTAKAMKNYRNKLKVYMLNEFKWTAAREFCEKRGMDFKVITEVEIYGE